VLRGSNRGFYEHEGLGCGLDLYYNQSNVATNYVDALTSHYNRGKKWDTTGDFGIYRQFFIINNLGISLDMDGNSGSSSGGGNDFTRVVQLVNITPDPVTQSDDPFCKTNITDADGGTVNATVPEHLYPAHRTGDRADTRHPYQRIKLDKANLCHGDYLIAKSSVTTASTRRA
jgi:hypothetical protein